MRILICGGREYDDLELLYDTLEKYKFRTKLVISGHARGADYMGEMWADENGIDVQVFPAKWQLHGKSAGPIRNQQMLDEGKPDLVIAFPGGNGTQDMIKRARQAGVEVKVVEYNK